MSNPAAVDGTKVLLGSGKLYFDRFDANGVTSGERFLGDCEKLELTSEDDIIELFSSADHDRGLIATANRKRTVTLAVQMREFDKENCALSMMGDTSPLVQTSATVTDEPIKSCLGDRYIRLSKRDITSITNVKKGATVYVNNTDYSATAADLVQGRIYVIPGGAIDALTHPDSLTCTYVSATITRQRIRGATASTIIGYLRYEADNSVGKNKDLEAWRVQVNPDTAVALIGQDWGELTFKGKVLNDAANHSTEPYYRLIER